jgi:hypothetical protein
LTLDLQIKAATGKTFIGGGTPPTLNGEGYINFGWPGIALGAFVLAALASWSAAAAFGKHARFLGAATRRARASVFGYMIAYASLAQVSGFVGASTVPITAFLVLVFLTRPLRLANAAEGTLADSYEHPAILSPSSPTRGTAIPWSGVTSSGDSSYFTSPWPIGSEQDHTSRHVPEARV